MRRTCRRYATATAVAVLAAISGCGRADERARTGHAGLACGDCHTGAATGIATRPAPPERCLECHAAADLPDSVALAGVRLEHTPHAELTETQSVPCSGCHGHPAGEEPIGVNTGNCFLCHADGDVEGPIALSPSQETCRTCHTELTGTALTSSDAPIDHGAVVEAGISCLQCHYDVLQGSGTVSGERCVACHGRERVLPSAGAGLGPDSVHDVHLATGRAVACTRCHGPLAHEVVALSGSVALDCVSCHTRPHDLELGAGREWPSACVGCHEEAHQEQQTLYTGLSTSDAPSMPAAMFLARVTCQACHSGAAMEATTPEGRRVAINRKCVGCHGAAYEEMLARWSTSVERRTAEVTRYVEEANLRSELTGNPPSDSLLMAASRQVASVLEANGLHNIPRADALLRSALRDAVSAYEAAGASAPAVPALGPNPTTVSCAHCHFGVETVRDSAFGAVFGHDAHVVQAGLSCTTCHSDADYFSSGTRAADPNHGQTTIARADCAGCHHERSAGRCVACHTDLSGAEPQVELTLDLRPEGAADSRTVTFAHTDHAERSCTDCHTNPTEIRAAVSCSECHTEHHQQARSCAGCHGPEVQNAHRVESHFTCTICHDPGTIELLPVDRAFCLSCHTGRSQHFPDRSCTPCHMQASGPDIKTRILGGR